MRTLRSKQQTNARWAKTSNHLFLIESSSSSLTAAAQGRHFKGGKKKKIPLRCSSSVVLFRLWLVSRSQTNRRSPLHHPCQNHTNSQRFISTAANRNQNTSQTCKTETTVLQNAGANLSDETPSELSICHPSANNNNRRRNKTTKRSN